MEKKLNAIDVMITLLSVDGDLEDSVRVWMAEELVALKSHVVTSQRFNRSSTETA